MALFRTASERTEYLFRCEKCGEQDWYHIDLAAHDMTEHLTTYDRRSDCLGKLVLVEKKVTPRS